MKPPIADDNHCTTISQTPAAIVNVVAVAPEVGQAEIELRPKPEPSKTRTTVNAAAAIAPPKIAAHEIAETEDSAARPESTGYETFDCISQRQSNASKMMIGNGTPSSQSRIPRPM